MRVFATRLGEILIFDLIDTSQANIRFHKIKQFEFQLFNFFSFLQPAPEKYHTTISLKPSTQLHGLYHSIHSR